jgi:hypothetical protein
MFFAVRLLALCLLLHAATASMRAVAAGGAASTCPVRTAVQEHKSAKAQKAGAGAAAEAEVTVLIDRACTDSVASASQGVDPPAQKSVAPPAPAAASPPAAAANASSVAPGAGKDAPASRAEAEPPRTFFYTAITMADFMLIALALYLLLLSLRRIQYDGLTFRRHWGGFGGASTGWTISPALALLLIGSVLACLAGAVTFELIAGYQRSLDRPTATDAPGKPGQAAGPHTLAEKH